MHYKNIINNVYIILYIYYIFYLDIRKLRSIRTNYEIQNYSHEFHVKQKKGHRG